jgi:hypothetical protein
VRLDSNRRFSLEVQLTGKRTQVPVGLVAADGSLRKASLLIHLDEYEALLGTEKPRFYFASAGVGVTYIDYRDSRMGGMIQSAVTPKASLGARFLKWFSAGVSGYVTLAPITKNVDPDARFLGLNFRVGFHSPWPKRPWSVALLTGYYYTTMFVSPPRFGFQNMLGPQLFPAVSYEFPGGKLLSSYMKFSPVSAGGLDLSFANFEVAGGLSFAFGRVGPGRFAATFDTSYLQLSISGVDISAFSSTLGVAYEL